MSEPKHISEALAESDVGRVANEISKRISGKTADDRVKEQADLFYSHLRSRKFDPYGLFTAQQVRKCCKTYGIEHAMFSGEYHKVGESGLLLTKTEQAAIDAWAKLKKPTKIKVERDHDDWRREDEEWMDVRAPLKQVIRFKYIGPLPKNQ